ncbi:MATE family efflux transporter [Acinetobacter qingfengensis]|uniref:Multidrug-efflux transporter n=1 Tax=Acinetobacter qingfengensis TaxID=1262585 RepID=A0A1E7R321_9GAMM|nr:MATE family efflux transporter [Acinetobacter qingfengensis]KAA8733763.1 MATE family efflux transporter [Acinetobacter qingfengensis]OEY93725.1 MATE family efflux transporter [Acinetobacter qingfengensis]
MSAMYNWGFELKQLLRLMLPILATQVAQAGFGLIDTIMAGQLSAADLAAIAIAVGIWLPVMLLCSGILMATSPLIAEAIGAKRQQNIPVITHQALWIAIFLGLIGMLILQLMPQFFHLLKVPENLHAKAGLFLHSIAFGIPAVALYSVLRCYCEALGHPHVVTIISLLALPVLIPLNLIFMHGFAFIPAMGSAGAGVANAILQWVMLFILIAYLRYAKAFTQVKLFQQFDSLDPVWAKRILKLGVPIGMAIFFEVSIFSTAALVISPLGDTVIAAHQIAISITSQLFMIPLSLAMALTIRVGQYYGAKNWQVMRQVQHIGFVVATVFASFTMLLLWLFRGWLIHLYNKDTAVFDVAYGLVIFAIAYQLIDAWQVTAAGCLRGMQDTKGPMWITLFAYWIIAFPLGIYLTRYALFSAAGVWIGLITGLFIACILLFIRLRTTNNRLNQSGFYSKKVTNPF